MEDTGWQTSRWWFVRRLHVTTVAHHTQSVPHAIATSERAAPEIIFGSCSHDRGLDHDWQSRIFILNVEADFEKLKRQNWTKDWSRNMAGKMFRPRVLTLNLSRHEFPVVCAMPSGTSETQDFVGEILTRPCPIWIFWRECGKTSQPKIKEIHVGTNFMIRESQTITDP